MGTGKISENARRMLPTMSTGSLVLDQDNFVATYAFKKTLFRLIRNGILQVAGCPLIRHNAANALVLSVIRTTP